MTETLFGGLLAVVLIFFVGRRFGLSNYWSGILGGALPFLAYLGLSAGHWPDGDVLAIHLVVFMATAGVLGVFSSIRRHQEKMHWAPKLIIAFFVMLTVFNAVLLSISTHGLPDSVTAWFLPNQDKVRVHTAFPGVVPHDRNKLYEEHQQRVAEQRDLGWLVEIAGLEQLKSGIPAMLTIKVRDARGTPVIADAVTSIFWRMANSKDDRGHEMQVGQPGEYSAEITLPDPGRWIVHIDIRRGAESYQTQHSLLVD
jgi:nitrogen fixation protein FixH